MARPTKEFAEAKSGYYPRDDAPCPRCGGKGCVACSAQHLPQADKDACPQPDAVERACARCRLLLNRNETGVRHGYSGPPHSEYRCIELLQREVVDATAAEQERLKPWLRHKIDCAGFRAGSMRCTCGLAAALRKGD